MENLVIGIVGMGMIGNTAAVLSTLHGVKTVAYVRDPQKDMAIRAEFEGVVTVEQAGNMPHSSRALLYGYSSFCAISSMASAVRSCCSSRVMVASPSPCCSP